MPFIKVDITSTPKTGGPYPVKIMSYGAITPEEHDEIRRGCQAALEATKTWFDIHPMKND